jgi:MFS family permease
VLIFASAAAAITQIPLLFLHSPLQLVIARSAFGLSASIMLPCIIRLLKNCAPSGMDSRAISYATSFQFIAMGLAPFGAGLIGPALGLRTYFAFTAAMTALATMLWIRSIRKG